MHRFGNVQLNLRVRKQIILYFFISCLTVNQMEIKRKSNNFVITGDIKNPKTNLGKYKNQVTLSRKAHSLGNIIN